MRCIEAQCAAGFVGADAGLFAGTFDLRQCRGDALHIALPDVGKGNAARGAIEKAHLQASFQAGHRAAHAGGGHAQFLCRATKTAAARNGQNHFQLSHSCSVHRLS